MANAPQTGPETVVIVGFGWVGQANGLSLRKMGWPVYFYDPATPVLRYADEYEAEYRDIPRLSTLLEKDSPNTWYVVCVGDRVSDDGVQDISFIRTALEDLKKAKGGVILRSTILPSSLATLPFDIYVPEFLHEKKAVEECLNPHFFVVGMNSKNRTEPSFLKAWRARAYKVFHGTPEEASFVKYLSNIWNSVRIAFINEFGDAIDTPSTPERLARIERVLDFVLERGEYLKYGKSFGGHCLPKDTRAFMRAYKEAGKNVALIEGTYRSNEAHMKLEEQYPIMPEWYSSWVTPRSSAARVFQSFKTAVLNLVEQLVPPRSFANLAETWSNHAKEKPLYYSYRKTPSGAQVTEEEFSTTGEEDYRALIANDPLLVERLGDTSSKTALDLGSGAGRMTGPLARTFKSVHAVDIAEPMLRAAQERLKDFKNISYHKTDGTKLPVEDASVDFVFSNLTLKHVPTEEGIQAILKEIERVLVPGGIAKVQVRTGKGLRRWKWAYGVSLLPRDAERLADDAGLSVLRESADAHDLWLWLTK